MSILSFWGKSQTRRDCSQFESATAIRTTFAQRSYQTENGLFHCLYVLYYAKVESYALNHGGQKADALDLFQDVVAVLLQNLEKLNVENEAFGPYLMGITKNIWHQRFRRKSSTERPTDFMTEHLSNDGEDLSEFLDQIEDITRLTEAIQILNEKEQRFVQLFYFEEKSYAEIAELMDGNAESLKANRTRIMRKLRDYLLNNQ
jgi:RNA polymerase sigma factor (sigma-70 family)